MLADPAPLRLDPQFRLLWAGQSISLVGRMVTQVVLPYQVYVLTQDLVMVGLLSLAQLVPLVVFALGGGAVADAVDRRRLLLVTNVSLAGCSAALLGLSLLAAPPVWALFVVAVVSAGLAAVDQPARSSALPRLVPPERLTAAISMNQLVFNGASVIGPAIGGVILATAGIAMAYLVDLVTYGAAILAVWWMAPIPPAVGAARASLRSIAEGLRYARRRPEILATFLVDMNAMVFGSPRALFPVLALEVFAVGPAGVGLMSSAVGLGAFIASVLSGWTSSIRRPGRAVLIAVAVWSLAIVGFGFSTWSFPLALLCLAIAAAADVISAMLRATIVQLATPDGLRGRVNSIHVLVVTGGPRLGDAEATAVAAWVGPQWSVLSGGLLSLAGVGVLTLALPRFARLDLREEADPAPPA
jgi:MFS family permease